MIPHRSSAGLLSLGLLVVAIALACAGAPNLAPSFAEQPTMMVQAQLPQNTGAERRRAMGAVNNWGYWLSSFEIAGVATAPHDLLVIDSEISANRAFERQHLSDEVARMKRRPDGSPRVLLAYLSIGEAERYRPYWQPEWYDLAKKPAWLGQENRRWAG